MTKLMLALTPFLALPVSAHALRSPAEPTTISPDTSGPTRPNPHPDDFQAPSGATHG
jgi:hypothetical protein